MKIENNHSLLEHNTFGINAHCRVFAQYDTPDELRQLLAQYPDLPMLHIGSGSNLLFCSDFDGLILHSNIQHIERLAPVPDDPDGLFLRVGAAVVWDQLVDYTLRHHWYGLENLSLIPGEVGASAVQNIGAYGCEAKDYIASVECLHLSTGQLRTFTNAECHYAYRHSIFKTDAFRGQWAVLYVTFRLSHTFQPRLDYGGLRAELDRQHLAASQLTASQLRQLIIDIRQSKLPDPRQQGNAGSFFTNPVVPLSQYQALARSYPHMPHYDAGPNHVKIPAAWLIEQCGWKGRALGPAAVHHRQALVLVNRGGATGQDILRLCQALRHDVRERFGIDLQPEVNIIGERQP